MPLPTWVTLRAAGLAAEIGRVYRQLGGLQPEPRISLGGWDIEADGVAVELDEDLHFNRYRRTTLDSGLYDRLRFRREAYGALCEEHEAECLRTSRWGKRWTQPRAEIEFGSAAAAGEFAGGGAPRWKQRVFYDFVKDTAPIAVGVDVCRLPIWETVSAAGQTYQLGILLELIADGALAPEEWSDPVLALMREHTFGPG